MRDYLVIGSSPADESCVQVGEEDYLRRQKEECLRFIDRIREVLGPEPEMTKLGVKTFAHDFGRYSEVVCFYEDTVPESVDYAFRVESEAPVTW